MPAAMQHLEWEECLIKPSRDPEIERAFRERIGIVPHVAAYVSRVPWIARATLDASLAQGQLVELDAELTGLLWLAVSQDSSCRYCFASHRAFLRIQGFRESRIRQLEQSVFSELDPARQAAIDFARRLSRSNPIVRPADAARLRAVGWSQVAATEIAFVSAIVVFSNRLATLPAIPPVSVEADPDRWYVQLLRPFLASRMRARLSRGRPAPLPPEMRTGPFQDIVSALDPLPVARVLWHMLDGCFASTALSPRCRALVFAVVARGLGCPRSEAEAKRLLAETDFPADELEPTLAHLASPALDAVEAAVVPFTRDTIRYSEAAPLQRRARRLRDQIGAAPFGDFVGVVGLANMLCRLSFVTESA